MSVSLRYRAFGLSIMSEIVLPAPLEPDGHGTPDVTVKVGPLQDPPGQGVDVAAVSRLLRLVFRAPDHWEVHANGLNPMQRFTAIVRPGRVEVGWNAGVEVADLGRHILGAVVAAHVHVSKRVCLHGCAILMEERALLVLGASGRGKSTLAAALVADGGRLVSEEIVVLGVDPVSVVAGVPAVKVSAQAADVLGLSGRAHPAYAHADYAHEGVLIDLDDAQFVSANETEMGDVYLLGERHAGAFPVVSQSLRTPEAALAVANSGYWMASLPPTGRGLVMQASLEIARRRRVRILSLPDDLTALSRAVRFLADV